MPSSRTRTLKTPPRIAPRLCDLLKFDEACDYSRLSATTLRQYIRDGRLHAYKLGPKILRFDPADLDALLSDD